MIPQFPVIGFNRCTKSAEVRPTAAEPSVRWKAHLIPAGLLTSSLIKSCIRLLNKPALCFISSLYFHLSDKFMNMLQYRCCTTVAYMSLSILKLGYCSSSLGKGIIYLSMLCLYDNCTSNRNLNRKQCKIKHTETLDHQDLLCVYA